MESTTSDDRTPRETGDDDVSDLRERLDGSLLRASAIGGNLIVVALVLSEYLADGNPWLLLGIGVGHSIICAVAGNAVAGDEDRRAGAWLFFLLGMAQPLLIMYVTDFSPFSMLLIPANVMFYDSFEEGNTRPFVIVMLSVLLVVPIALGADAGTVLMSVVIAGLIHWLKSIRGRILRESVDELQARAAELHRANGELTRQRAEIEENYAALQAAQTRLVQSEKMAGVGQLAAGIAHEINNPLGVILGFTQGMERRLDDESPHRIPVSSIRREATRCKTLVRELLTFARSGDPQVEELDFCDAVEGALVLLRPEAKNHGVQLRETCTAAVRGVAGNRTQLQQILVNLGSNAIDAAGEGGSVDVFADVVDDSIRLEIRDDGDGIPPDIRDKIYEPFFTTKGPDEGTGLGLSLVYEIVEQHGGTIDIDTQPGEGTTVRVELPASPTVLHESSAGHEVAANGAHA